MKGLHFPYFARKNLMSQLAARPAQNTPVRLVLGAKGIHNEYATTFESDCISVYRIICWSLYIILLMVGSIPMDGTTDHNIRPGNMGSGFQVAYSVKLSRWH